MPAMEYTYQDYLEVLETNSETQLIQFVLNAIQEHKRSEKYEIAADRISYDSKGAREQPFAENDMNRVTIMIAE